ncbi:MAG: hypothetical protein R3F59_08880 [Myxococcota bacterium]
MTCLDALTLPASGSVAAHAAYQRALLAQATSQPDVALEATRAAHAAEPELRFYARRLARLVQERGEASPELLSEAIDAAAVAVGEGEVAAEAPERLRRQAASDRELRGQLLLAAGRAEEALPDLRAAYALQPTPARQLRVGLALAGAGHADEAGLELARGLAVELDDTATIAKARDALRPIAEGWLPGGMKAMIAAAGRSVDDEVQPAHPLVGRAVTDAALLPTPPQGAGAPPASAQVVVLWDPRFPASQTALERIAAIAAKYGPRGVVSVALDVGGDEADWPEGVTLEHRHAGPGAMRALQTVALPTVLVLDGKGRVAAGPSPYDPTTLDVETALDAVVPAD